MLGWGGGGGYGVGHVNSTLQTIFHLGWCGNGSKTDLDLYIYLFFLKMIHKETEVKINLILDYVCKRCEKLNVDTVPSTSPWGHSTVHPFMTIERVNHFENIPKVRKSWLIIWYSGYPNRRDCIWMKIVCCLFAARKGGPKNKYKNSEEEQIFFLLFEIFIWIFYWNAILSL